MTQFSASYRTLCELTDGELALFLRNASKKHTEESITSFLRDGVEREGIPPSVFCIWLSIAKQEQTLAAAMYVKSRYVRRCAIGRLGKALKCKTWHATWRSIGGIEGLLALFERSSVEDVLYLVKALRPSAKSAQHDAQKQNELMTLFKALLPQWFPESPHKTTDRRRLSHIYAFLLPVCSPEFIMDFLSKIANSLGQSKLYADKRLLLVSFDELQRRAKDRVTSNSSDPSWIKECLPKLLQHLPPLPSTRFPGWSVSMEFSMVMLQDLANNSESKVLSPEMTLTVLIMPLLRRLKAKKVGATAIREVLDLSVKYASQHKHLPRSHPFSGPHKESFYSYVSRQWSRNTALFERTLESTLKLMGKMSSIYVNQCNAYLLGVPKFRRFHLLRLLGKFACGQEVDIEDTVSLSVMKVETVWDQKIFLSLLPKDALQLLESLTESLGQDPRLTLSSQNSLGHRRAETYSTNADIRLTKIILAHGSDAAFKEAKGIVEEKKKLSIRSREQGERCFHAEGALLFSVASNSLALYGETLEWSRRYIRDSLTVKGIFSAAIVKTEEGIALLSGLEPPYDRLSKADISSRVRLGNEILLKFLDFACAAIREPSFHRWDWESSLALFTSVVRARISRSAIFQEKLKLSVEELYEIVWKDTLAMLLKAESIGLSEDYNDLGFNETGGVISDMGTVRRKELDQASARFFDDLAQARNTLWVEKRALDDPATTTLPEPWPRGLPIQDLVPLHADDPWDNNLSFPYLMERAEAVVFMPREVACAQAPGKNERKTVISFVDDLGHALGLFVNAAASKKEREERISRAWNHALSDFSVHTITHSENMRRWGSTFQTALWDTFYKDKSNGFEEADRWQIAVPNDADVHASIEWNPDEGKPEAVESRYVDATVVDCCANVIMFETYQGEKYQLELSGYKPQGIWNLHRLNREALRSGKTMEAYIACALLSLDAAKKGPSRVLSVAFPETGSSKRYPPLFLDGDFLNQDFHHSSAFEVLEKWLPRVPSNMLLSIAQGAFDTLSRASSDSPEVRTIEAILYKTLRLLSRSDKPAIALDLVCRAVLDRPDSSSWYRQIFTRRLFKILSPIQAMEFVENFANRLTASKSRSMSTTSKANEGGEKPSSGSAMKITTVKMLAEVLKDADVFSVPTAISILKQISLATSHIDVRVAVVSATIALVASTPNNELSDFVLSEVESFLVSLTPVVGSLSERDGPKEDMWTTSYTNKDLPAVDSEAPLYDLLTEARSNKADLPKSIIQTIDRKVLVPAIDESIRNNKKWIELFIVKHGLKLNVEDYPIPPKNWEILKDMVERYVQWLPARYLELYHTYLVCLLTPASEIRKATEKVQENPQLRGTEEGRHFLDVFSHAKVVRHLRNTSHASLLKRAWKWPQVEGAANLELVKQHTLHMARVILEADDVTLKMWNYFIGPYEISANWLPVDDRKTWNAVIKPLLRKFIDMAESYRTQRWQQDRARRPRRLPPTLPLRLMLLSHPYMESTEEQNDETFASELCTTIDQLAEGRQPYHRDFKELKRGASKGPPQQCGRVACIVASVSTVAAGGSLPLGTLLRIELADALLREGELTDTVLEECRNLVRSWFESGCEQVRETAWRLKNELYWLSHQHGKEVLP